MWHRGYPLELIPNRFSNTYIGKSKRKVMIQADLWDGVQILMQWQDYLLNQL